jgi:hypothetical protein
MPELKDWLNLISPRYLVPVAVTTGFLVFASDQGLQKLGLTSLKQTYEAWIGGTFLLSSVLIASHMMFGLVDWFRGFRARRNMQLAAYKRLHHLSLDEKLVLQPFLVERVLTRNLDFTHGAVATLEHEGIIAKAASTGSLIDGWPYRIQDWALNYLQANPELIGLVAEPLPPTDGSAAQN